MTHVQHQSAAVSSMHSASAEAPTFQDEQVQKRMAIGLPAQRPTAKPTPQRPPEKETSDRVQLWTLVGVISALIVATLLLVFAKVADAPTSWPWIVRSFAGSVASPGYPGIDANGYLLMAGSDFDEPDTTLAAEERPGTYVMGQVPEDGVYRMRLWPDNMAWSVLATGCASPAYHIQTNAVVAADSPSGYAGLVGRYKDSRNFYLFHVDGAGGSEVLLMQDGIWQTVRPWQAHPAINTAGVPNDLSLKDDGQVLVFAANGQTLHEVGSPALSAGSVGLAGRAMNEPVELNFDSFLLYGPSCGDGGSD